MTRASTARWGVQDARGIGGRRVRCERLGAARRPLALAGCGDLRNPLAGDTPSTAPPPTPAVANPPPDSRGVITYATYQVAVARDGDTLASVAAGSAPPRPRAAATRCPRTTSCAGRGAAAPRQRVASHRRARRRRRRPQPLGSTPEGASAAIEGRRAGRNPFRNGQTEPLIDPVRHRVEAGETAYSIARLYGVSVTALGSWNGLGPDLAVRSNQELLIPIVGDANRISTSVETEPGQATPVAPRRAPRHRFRRHHRRGRPRLADLGGSAPPGRPPEPAGLGQRQPPLRRRQSQRDRLRGPRRHPGERRRPGRGRAGLGGARRARHHRAGPAPGRPDHHLFDAVGRAGEGGPAGPRPAR